MPTTFARTLLLITTCAFTSHIAFAAGQRGWFGFEASTETEGVFWNPTLVSITIENVVPGSPAAAAGLAKGDLVLQLEGRPIAGSKGREVEARIDSKSPGDKLVALLKRANGDRYTAALIAAEKPEK